MIPVNGLGSDSPLYFSLPEHHCANPLKRINRTAVTSALLFRAQSRCPQQNDRPCVSVEAGTCTNHSTECCSARCSPFASQSPREWIQVRQSARQFQLHLDGPLANRAAHRHASLRGNIELDSRGLAAFFCPPVCLLRVQILSAWRPHSTITTALCPAFKCGAGRKECTPGLSVSGVPVRGQQGKSDQIKRSTSCRKAEEH
jgi:hypothetical protein